MKKLILILLIIGIVGLFPVTQQLGITNIQCEDKAPDTPITLVSYSDNVSQNVTLKNPTFQEMKTFLLSDNTSKNLYIPGKYICTNFVADVCNNADKQGIRCAVVVITYTNGMQHGCVAFQTLDRGLLYIDPQTDRNVELEVGETYNEWTVKEVLVIW